MKFLEGIFEAMLTMVNIVIKIAPYAVFALIADVVGQFGLELLVLLAKYTLITLGGLFFLWATYIPLTYFFSPLNIFGFIRGVWPVMGIAFSTSSSAASLPIMMDTCEKRLGVSESICNFVLPLSITINMNGTALYHGVSAVFIAQVYGIPLTTVDQIMIVLIATLAAIGGAGVPGIRLYDARHGVDPDRSSSRGSRAGPRRGAYSGYGPHDGQYHGRFDGCGAPGTDGR